MCKYLGGNVNHNVDLSIVVNRRIRNAWCSFREYTLELYDPTERSHRAQNQGAKSRGTRDNDVRLRHVEPARVPLRHAASSPPQVPDSLHRLEHNRADHPPISYLDTPMKTGSERASRRLYAGGGFCSRDLWRAWRIRDCRSA